MERRVFVTATGQTALLALTGGVAKLSAMLQATPTLAGVEERVAAIIEAYDAQGNHRTATTIDRLSGEWLAGQVRRLHINPVFEPFTVNRVDLQSCYVRIAERRLDGVPLFDAGFTGVQGFTGQLGLAR
jgi:hypothetical protein